MPYFPCIFFFGVICYLLYISNFRVRSLEISRFFYTSVFYLSDYNTKILIYNFNVRKNFSDWVPLNNTSVVLNKIIIKVVPVWEKGSSVHSICNKFRYNINQYFAHTTTYDISLF